MVAVLGYAATLLGSWMSGRRAYQLAMYQRDMERTDARDNARETYFRDLLSAARLLRLSTDADAYSTALADVRRAAAGVELYAPQLAHELLPAALETIERLARTRAEGTWHDQATEAETDCDRAIAALREAMQATLGVADHVSGQNPRPDNSP